MSAAAADAADFGCCNLRREASGGSTAVADAGAVARTEAPGPLRVYKHLLAGAAVAHEQRAVQYRKHGCAYGHGITSDCGLTASVCSEAGRGARHMGRKKNLSVTGSFRMERMMGVEPTRNIDFMRSRMASCCISCCMHPKRTCLFSGSHLFLHRSECADNYS